MNNTNAKFAKDKYQQLSELGSRFNLSFSSHMEISNKLIALDGIKKSLLVLEINDEWNQSYIIDLNEIASVSVKKSYGNIRPGELHSKGIEDFLQRIELQFEHANKKETINLPFFEIEKDDFRHLPRLERNAKNWQMILSKMAGITTNKHVKELSELS